MSSFVKNIKIYEGKKSYVIDVIKSRKVSLVINVREDYNNGDLFGKRITDGYLIRRAAIDNNYV